MDQQSPTYETVLKYAFLVTPYAAVMSLQYLWGYWGSFNINIFNFLSLADVFKLALLPLVYLVGVAVSGASIIYLTTLFVERGQKKDAQPLPKRFELIINAAMVLVGILLIIFMTGFERWLYSGVIAAILLARILEDLTISKSLIANRNLRFCIAILITLPVFSSYGIGKRNAQSVLRGEDKARFVDTKLFREFGYEAFTKKHLFGRTRKIEVHWYSE